MKSVLLAALRVYQWLLSPWLGNQCRYWPTCSEYARQAIAGHGALRGSVLAVGRLLRCQPWSTGGLDPVPARFNWRCACGASCAAPEHADNRAAPSKDLEPRPRPGSR